MKRLILLVFFVCFASISIAQPPRPKFTISGKTQNFGNVTVTKTKDLVVTLRADSTATAAVHVSVDLPLTNQYSILNNDTGFTISIGATHTFTIRFAPTSVGTLNDSLYIHHDGDTSSAKNPTKIRMLGTGIASDTFPKINVPQKTINFGNVSVGVQKQNNFIIWNSSDTIRTLKGKVGSAKGSPFMVASGEGAFTLYQSDTMRIYVNFKPTVAGTFHDTLIISSNADTANDTVKVILNGTGIGIDTIPKITVNPKFVLFGSVRTDSSTIKKILVINSGTDTVHSLIGSIQNPHTPSYIVTKGAGAYSLKKGDTLSVEITFAPKVVGTILDTLLITSNSDTANQKINVILYGTGVVTASADTVAKVLFNRKSLVFDSVIVGATPQALLLTITNSSTADLPLNLTFTNPSSPFVFSGGAPITLAKGQAHTDTIRFRTDYAGTYSDSIVVFSNTSDLTKRTVVRLSGVIKPQSSVNEIAPEAERISIYPNPASNSTMLTLHLSRGGFVSATIIDISGKEIKSFAGVNITGDYSLQFDCSTFTNGVYFVKLNLPSGSRMVRFVVAK